MKSRLSPPMSGDWTPRSLSCATVVLPGAGCLVTGRSVFRWPRTFDRLQSAPPPPAAQDSATPMRCPSPPLTQCGRRAEFDQSFPAKVGMAGWQRGLVMSIALPAPHRVHRWHSDSPQSRRASVTRCPYGSTPTRARDTPPQLASKWPRGCRSVAAIRSILRTLARPGARAGGLAPPDTPSRSGAGPPNATQRGELPCGSDRSASLAR